jgi:hypothetical protein
MRNDARGVVPLLAALCIALPASAAPLFKYYGGRVVSNAQVVQVYWTSTVSSAVQTGLPAFYTAILDSSYLDWLSEYSTVAVTPVDAQPGTQQRIGRGNYVTAVTITPANTATTLSNLQIHTELAAQIAAGHLPAPTTDATGNVNTVYMVDFPPTYTITVGGASSCASFCAAYDTMIVGGKSVGVGLFPEIITGPCAAICGTDLTPFNNVTAVHAGQLIQIITDLEFPIATASTVRPTAWFSNQPSVADTGNVADVCNHQHATVAGFVVEKGWSNKLASCIASTATPLPLCDLTTTYCRQCSASDNGQPAGCNGTHPVCQTDATSAARGQCIACTTDAQCTGNSAGTHCLATGACAASSGSPLGSPGTGGGGSSGGCSTSGALPFAAAFGIAIGSVLVRWRRRGGAGRGDAPPSSASTMVVPVPDVPA